MVDSDFIHVFVKGTDSSATLLLLHGTGGDENQLLPLGKRLAPGVSLISPRGKVLENGAPRFFRRFAEGVLDVEDLKIRTGALAEFVTKASQTYSFDKDSLLAVGYSNGANMAASMMLLYPTLLAGAVLFRPMVPFRPQDMPDLASRDVLILGGKSDPMVPEDQTEGLAKLLQEAGASVQLRWAKAGHSMLEEEVEFASEWVQSTVTRRSMGASRNTLANAEDGTD